MARWAPSSATMSWLLPYPSPRHVTGSRSAPCTGDCVVLLDLITSQDTFSPMDAKIGDKVRIKINGQRSRGIVEGLKGRSLLVRVDDSTETVRVAAEGVTNYSLAATKAWKSMPERRVGRPKGTQVCDRLSVTLRIDRDLWERFQLCESKELIEDRTSTINEWLREKVEEVERSQG